LYEHPVSQYPDGKMVTPRSRPMRVPSKVLAYACRRTRRRNLHLAVADAIDLKTALTTLRSQAQSLSSNLSTVQIRQDFTKAMINTLNSGADSLTLADSNEEGANLLALQTRQQLSTTALSLASQADQNVLRLFQ